MKRFILSILAIGLGLLVVTISALSVGRKQLVGSAGAKELVASSAAKLMMPTEERAVPMEPVEKKVDYYLPYPGLLPDHPLYLIKMMRDRWVLVTTSDSSKKFELDVLYADKRIGAAEVLVKGGKKGLGASTTMKAEGYLLKAMAEAKKVDKDEVWQTLYKSVIAHENIITGMMKDLTGQELKDVEEAMKMTKTVLTAAQQRLKIEEKVNKENISNEPDLQMKELVPAEIGT